MTVTQKCRAVLSSAVILAVLLSGCGTADSASPSSSAGGSTQAVTAGTDTALPAGTAARETIYDFPVPEASGTLVFTEQTSVIDASSVSDGYVMIRCSDESSKIKVQITCPDGTPYNYTLTSGDYRTFPLTGGSGTYKIAVLRNTTGDMYTYIQAQEIDVEITDEFSPFLYPNQYVWYTADDDAAALAESLSEESADDLDYLTKVYHYVIEHIVYDEEKASETTVLVPPDIDETLASGKGICIDYASLMAAMLRCQGIPTRLVFGYSGTAYHAWINVWLDEVGWVDKIIEFDGENWSLMDPTFAANNSQKAVKKYTGDASNYTVKYWY